MIEELGAASWDRALAVIVPTLMEATEILCERSGTTSSVHLPAGNEFVYLAIEEGDRPILAFRPTETGVDGVDTSLVGAPEAELGWRLGAAESVEVRWRHGEETRTAVLDAVVRFARTHRLLPPEP